MHDFEDSFDYIFKSRKTFIYFSDTILNKCGNFKFCIKVVIIGDSGTGKTSILQRYTNNEFSLDAKTTIG